MRPLAATAYELAGQRFGRLLVIELAGRDRRGHVTWSCRCDCGAACVRVGHQLVQSRRETRVPMCTRCRAGAYQRAMRRTYFRRIWAANGSLYTYPVDELGGIDEAVLVTARPTEAA